jgi:hypothetical protein
MKKTFLENYNRSFGSLFMLGLLLDVALRIFLPTFWR